MGEPFASVCTVEPWLGEALKARFLAPWLDGRHRFAAETVVHRVARAADLLEAGTIEQAIDYDWGELVLARAADWSALVDRERSGRATVRLTAATSERLDAVRSSVESRVPAAPLAAERVSIDFWLTNDRRAYTVTRSFDAPDLDEVVENYPQPVMAALDKLRATELTDGAGRIVLWHGPPGTGKTTAIRALARAWKSKGHRFQVILDPDVVFQRSSRLNDVLLDDDGGPGRRRAGTSTGWRVLVVEDADELVRADAKNRVGQALSRLLNLGDGLLGQGIRTLVLVTTNEPVGRLHPALVRPGRCLSEIEFRRFTRTEASDLLHVDPGRELTLAEVFAWRRGERIAATEPAGLYL